MHVDPDDTSPGYPEDFRAAVVAQLTAAGYSVAKWEGAGVNVRAARTGKAQYLGLSNLFRRAKAADPGEWPALIGGFVRRLTRATTEKVPDDLRTVADRLRPR